MTENLKIPENQQSPSDTWMLKLIDLCSRLPGRYPDYELLNQVAALLREKPQDAADGMLHVPKPIKLMMLSKIQDALDSEAFWELFRSCWSLAENHFQEQRTIKSLLSARRIAEPERLACMTEQEMTMMTNFPEKVRIYRGGWKRNIRGWSYTLDRERALWFAKRCPRGEQSLLLEALVRKEHIILYLECRQESEVIVNPAYLLRSSMVITEIKAEHSQPSV